MADEGGTATGTIVETVSGGAVVAAAEQALTGFAAHGDSVRAVIATLDEAIPAPLFDDGETLRMGASDAAIEIIGDAMAGGMTSRLAAGQVPDEVSIGYHDPVRDFQAGLQRATLGGPGRMVERIALPAAIEAGTAKGLAAARLDAFWRTRERRSVSLPWRDMRLRPGRLVRFDDETRVWQVTGWTLERMAVKLELVGHAGVLAAVLASGPGRAITQDDFEHGPTTLRLFDAPSLGEVPATEARLLAAAAGTSRGWRVAALEASHDGGLNRQPAGATAPAAVMGTALGVLGAAASTLFDRREAVEVELLNEEMWLESRDDDALVAGANLAMLGDELIQFGDVSAVGPRRFRLSRLLRGRRGSEWAAGIHKAGDAFVLIEAESLVSVAIPAARVGGVTEVAARGIGDGDVPVIATATGGIEAVRPPSPVHLRAERRADGAIVLRWTRRSRAGWAWIDGIDAPLGEASETYRVSVSGGARVAEVATPEWTYDAAAQGADGTAAGFVAEVVQVGSLAVSRSARIVVDA